MSNKNGSVCAIVGAGEGLGASLARVFAQHGCDIALLSRTAAGSAAAREAVVAENSDVRVINVQADAAKAESLGAGLSRVASELGPIDILIYNVRGSIAFRRPLDVTCAELRDILDIEVVGALAATQAVLPSMIERRRGTILYSSATAALRGSATGLLYATAKFGLRGLA